MLTDCIIPRTIVAKGIVLQSDDLTSHRIHPRTLTNAENELIIVLYSIFQKTKQEIWSDALDRIILRND